MKNIDSVSRLISIKLEIPYEIVKKVNKIYWKDIRDNMKNLNSPNLYIRNLGIFTSSRYLNAKLIKEVIYKLRNLHNKNIKESSKILTKIDLENKLKKLLIQRNEIAKIYYEKQVCRIHKINS